jgi:hypothetical protein
MIPRRMRERSSPVGARLGLALAILLGAAACGEHSASRVAARVLEKYRKASGAKPLPASGMIRLRLSGADAAAGRDDILWAPRQYRETVTSAGMTVVHGIESGRAYFIDQDAVTRVVSDQVLRELRTRSYFWRRAWLFTDHERAWLELGPSDAATVSLDLTPDGGNRLRLVFARDDGRLVAVRSPRFVLEFSTPTRWRDASDPSAIVEGELAWSGLPTGPVPEAWVGGGRAAFGAAEPAAVERRAGAAIVPAVLGGRPVRLAIDGAESGPVAVSPALADRLGVAFTPDVYGRRIAADVPLSLAGVSWPSLWIRRAEAVPPGADAVAGGCVFRETVVEFDPAASRLALHDPAAFAPPESYFRIPIDDDGDAPVAVLNRGKTDVRLIAASDTGSLPLLLASASAARMGFEAGRAHGLAWGSVILPELPFGISNENVFPEWGDDGRLGFPLLLRFHDFVDMSHRWIYVKPLEK